MPDLDRGSLPGLTRAQSLEAGGDWATIYRVTPASIRAGPADVPLHVSAEAAIAWLDLAGGAPGGDAAVAAARRLADTGAIVVGPDLDVLATRLAGIACLAALMDEGPAARIVAAGPPCAVG
jgi:hypothetical protein